MEKYIEATRPPLYRAMKYWGKKPHNIWSELIKKYTKPNDIVLDPFAGSGVSFLESIRLNRKPVAVDINPVSNFILDVYQHNYDIDYISELAINIIHKAKNLTLYKKNFRTICNNCGYETDVYNYVWDNNETTHFSYKCSNCKRTISERFKTRQYYVESLGCWEPTYDLSNLSSIHKNTLVKLGGNDFRNLWTERNFQLLVYIFEQINKINEPYKNVLLFAFLQIVHLTSKMCASRSEHSNRPLSTSWGRPAYMALTKFMEQNPVIQFERSIFSKNGIINAFISRKSYIAEYSISKSTNFFEKDGIVLNKNFLDVELDENVDFIITDPPYGDIIQYGELSLIWNLWLVKSLPEYKIDLSNEIIINNEKDAESYKNELYHSFIKCYNLLKENGYMIFTFNSSKYSNWKLLKDILFALPFNIEDIHLQVNRRTGEANVGAKDGTSISDYYIVLKKSTENKNKIVMLTKLEKMLKEGGKVID
ncbi:DNA methyltransferase [Tetragenococcus halophilus]|uniref:DNA methyltransferase n=1 Tax=Tetragenococcus halophilus TaxID=51669 RepID=UPI0030F08FE8